MWLTIRSGGGAGKQVEVTGERFVVGREEGCDLVLDDEKVSRRHAAFEALGGGRYAVRDLDSANGTYAGGERVTAPVMLQGGEEIRLGGTVLGVSLAPPGAAAPTELAGAPPTAPAQPAAPPPARPAPVAAAAPPPLTPSRVMRIQHAVTRWKWIAIAAAVAALGGLGAALAVAFTGGSEQVVLVQTETVREALVTTVVVTETTPAPTTGGETAPAPTTPADTTPSTTPEGDDGTPSEAEAALLEHIPSTYTECWRPSETVRTQPGVVAAIGCSTADAVSVLYLQFDGADSASSWYDGVLAFFDVTRDTGECLQDPVAETTWEDSGGEIIGRVLCAAEEGYEDIYWTHDSLWIVANAYKEGTGAEVRQAVFDAWRSAGPR